MNTIITVRPSVRPDARPSVRGQLVKMLITIEPHGMFNQIMQHSSGNDRFAFHTFLLAQDIIQSTFTTGRANYGQMIFCLSCECFLCSERIETFLFLYISIKKRVPEGNIRKTILTDAKHNTVHQSVHQYLYFLFSTLQASCKSLYLRKLV